MENCVYDGFDLGLINMWTTMEKAMQHGLYVALVWLGCINVWPGMQYGDPVASEFNS